MFELIFSFAGRVNRSGFIKGNLIVLVVLLFSGGLFAFFGPEIGSEFFIPQFTIFAILTIVFAMITTTALGIKRSHDLGWSGWLVILMFLPFVGFVYSLLLLFKMGTVGENKYGVEPFRK